MLTQPAATSQSTHGRYRTCSRLMLSLSSACFLAAFNDTATASNSDPLPLMLAKSYQQQDNISDYWVSEKLDGVRAFWDGQQLRTRQGNLIHAPKSVLNALPKVALDGELWLGRGRFAELSGIVRRLDPDENEWRDIHYRVFDLPEQLTSFDQRVADIKTLCQRLDLPWLQPVEQKNYHTGKL